MNLVGKNPKAVTASVAYLLFPPRTISDENIKWMISLLDSKSDYIVFLK